jgi:hypothetical protein
VAASRSGSWASDGGLRPFPSAYRSAPLLGAPVATTTSVQPIATVPPPGAVIAASAQSVEVSAVPTTAAIDEDTNDLFAMDRTVQAQAVKLLDVQPLPVQRMKIGSTTDYFPEEPWNTVVWACDKVTGFMPQGLYVNAEYLLWWTRRDHAPVLGTTGSPMDGPLAGRLSQPDTSVVFDGSLGHEPRSGARLTVGYFFDDCYTKSIEVTGFYLPNVSGPRSASSAVFPVLARPFFSLNEGIERVQFTAFPGVVSGTLSINSPSTLGGLEVNGRCMTCCGCNYFVDLLAGLRFLSLDEQLTITEDQQFAPGVLPPPFVGHVAVVDSFTTKNQFYGGQVGALAQKEWGRLVVEGVFKLALGVTHQEVSIQGAQFFPPGTPGVDTRPGGLFALNSNIGEYSRNRFAVVPEVGITLGWNLTESVQLTVGYNFLYWSSVVRPGQQIDRNIDVTRIPNFFLAAPPAPVPGLHPGVLFKESDFWAQGLTAGVRFTF